MARASLIPHPSGEPLVMIRKSFMDLFMGDACAAALLQHFDYLTGIEIQRFISRGEKGIPWVQVGMQQLEDDLLRIYSLRRIRDRIAVFCKIGILKESSGGSRYKSYLLDVELSTKLVSERSKLPISDMIGQLSDELIGQKDVNLSDQTVLLSDQTDAYIGRDREVESSPPTPSLCSEPQNDSTEGPTLDTNEATHSQATQQILWNLKNLPGVRSIGKTLKNWVIGKCLDYTGNELLEAFERFQGETFWRGSDSDHIVRSFFDYASKGPKTGRSVKPNGRVRGGDAVTHDNSHPTQPAASKAQNGASVTVNYAELWGKLVPRAALPPPIERTWTPPKDALTPEFKEHFEVICQKVNEFIDKGGALTFAFLVRMDVPSNMWNWQRLLTGDLDWQLPRAKKPKKDLAYLDKY